MHENTAKALLNALQFFKTLRTSAEELTHSSYASQADPLQLEKTEESSRGM